VPAAICVTISTTCLAVYRRHPIHLLRGILRTRLVQLPDLAYDAHLSSTCGSLHLHCGPDEERAEPVVHRDRCGQFLRRKSHPSEKATLGTMYANQGRRDHRLRVDIRLRHRGQTVQLPEWEAAT
jgi:hypothetical protein